MAIGDELDRRFGELHEAGRRRTCFLALARSDSRESFGRELVAGEGHRLLRRRALTQHRGDRHKEERRSGPSASPRIAPASPAPPGPRIVPVSRSGWAMKTISAEAAPIERLAAGRGDDGEQREIGRRGGDVGRARDVALLARLGEPLRRRVEDLLAAALAALAHRGIAIRSASSASSRPFQKFRITGAASIRSRRPPAVIAGAPMKATISCGMARLIAPSARL